MLDRVFVKSPFISGCFFYSLTLPTLVWAQASSSTDDIRDIRGPVHIGFKWSWVYYPLLVLALVYAGIWAYFWFKGRKKPRPKMTHEIALERFESAKILIQKEEPREFSIVVSEAVREYIEARFGEKAAHLTTEEFLHKLLTNQNSPLLPFSDSLQDFLNHCDFAKFAKGSLTAGEMKLMLESARSLVEHTKPVEVKEAATKE